MNERIKELALQASEKHDYNPEFAKIFAELIVRECVELFPKQNMYGGNAIQNIIKDNFGVKE